MKVTIALVFAFAASAATITVTPVPTAISTTQAVVSFTPTADPCTYSASAAVLGSTITPDTSNLPTVDVDGSRYVLFGYGSGSAALPAGATVTLGVSCNGGADTGSTLVVTPAASIGNFYTSQPPFDPTQFGNYGWPSIDPNDQSRVYIDPMTGRAIKRITGRGWYGNSNYGQKFLAAKDPGSVWTNIESVNSGVPGTTGICTHANGSADCYVYLPLANLLGFGGQGVFSWDPEQTLDNIQVQLFGSGAATTTFQGCIASGPATNTSTCLSSMTDFGTVPTSTGPGAKFPATNWPDAANDSAPTAQSFWSGWGGFMPVQMQLSGAGVLLRVKSNSPSGAVRLSANMNYAYSGGFQVPGKGDTAHCSQLSQMVSYAADGVTPITPVAGELCLFRTDKAGGNRVGLGGVLALLIPSTAETRLLTPIYFLDPYAPGISVNFDAFSDSDPNTFYVMGSSNSTGAIFKGVYDAVGSHFKAYTHSLYPCSACPGGGGYTPGQSTAAYWFNGPGWPDSGIAWTNITPATSGNDPETLIEAGNPGWCAGCFQAATLGRLGGGRAVMVNYGIGGAETPMLVSVFDLTSNPAKLIKTGNTWDSHNWGANHDQTSLFLHGAAEQWFAVATSPIGGVYIFGPNPGVFGVGPFQTTPTKMLKSGSFGSDTSMTATTPSGSDAACPGTIPPTAQFILNSFGTPGPYKCVTIQHPMACSQTPLPAEAAKYPCDQNPAWSELQPLSVGDQIDITATGEALVVVTPPSLVGGTTYQTTFVRCADPAWGCTSPPTNWKAWAVPPASHCDHDLTPGHGCTNGNGMWSDVKAAGAGMNWQIDPNVFGGHSDQGPGPTSGHSSYCTGAKCRYDLSPFINMPFNVTFTGAPTAFGGLPYAPIQLQSYPSMRQYQAATPAQKEWLADQNAINPATGVGPEVPSNVCPVSSALVAGTTTVFKFAGSGGTNSNICGPFNQKLSPLIGWAGYHLLKDVSSPITGNIITDASPWQVCTALNPDECRTGSAAGDVYMSVPGGVAGTSCVSNSYAAPPVPCALTSSPGAAVIGQHVVSLDDHYTLTANAGLGLMGYGRQYQLLTSPIPDPTGQLIIYNGSWVGGYGNDLYALAALASIVPDGIVRNNFLNTPVTFAKGATAGCCSAGDTARLAFGYAEFGPLSSLFGTPRAEATVTDEVIKPFAFISEHLTGKACANGCAVNLPLTPGKIGWYRTQVVHGDKTVTSGPLTPVAESSSPCSGLTISSNSVAPGAAGGAGAFSVTADSGCSWTASSTVGWITTTASGTGNGTAGYMVAVNTGPLRVGAVTVGPRALMVTQAAGTAAPAMGGISEVRMSDMKRN